MKSFSVQDYFVTKTGLHVYGEFTQLIAAAYPEPIKKKSVEGMCSFELIDPLDDFDVLWTVYGNEWEKLARKHATSPDQIAEMIYRQPNGVDGLMRTDSIPNIFFVVGICGNLFQVITLFNSKYVIWEVGAWPIGDSNAWVTGVRFLYNYH